MYKEERDELEMRRTDKYHMEKLGTVYININEKSIAILSLS